MYFIIFTLLLGLAVQQKIVQYYKPENLLKQNSYVLNIFNKKNKNQDAYFATLIHDLKTPVYAQIRIIKMLLKGNFGSINTEQKQILKEILNSQTYMADIISNILTAYKFDCSQLKLNKHNFDIAAALNTIYESLKFLAEDKNQQLQINYKCSNLEAYGDNLQLTRVMTNLISNAIKYGNSNSTITVDLINQNGNISFSVRDYGENIPKEKLDKIFDKFNGGMTHYNSASTGLGLYLSKKIIQMHGGKIYAHSTDGTNEFGFMITNRNNFPNKKQNPLIAKN